MFYIRQGATHKVVIGPAVAVGDGFTPVTTLALSTADEAEVILHDNGTVVSISGYTWAAITTADGYYHLTLQSGISNTVGHMTVVINDDSLCLPLRADFTVLEEAVYDAMFAASAPGYVANAPVNVAQFGGSNGTFASGRPEVNTTHIGGTSQTGRDIGASVLLSSGTGTGQLLLSSGVASATLANTAHGGAAATLALKELEIIATDTDAAAVTITGDGAGSGIDITGGSYGVYITGNGTTGNALYLQGGTASGSGLVISAGSHAVDIGTTDGGNAFNFTFSAGGNPFSTNAVEQIRDSVVAIFVDDLGTAQAGASGSITLRSGAVSTDDYYNNAVVTITGGTGAGQSRQITDYVGSTRVASVDTNWVTTPDNTSEYLVLGRVV